MANQGSIKRCNQSRVKNLLFWKSCELKGDRSIRLSSTWTLQKRIYLGQLFVSFNMRKIECWCNRFLRIYILFCKIVTLRKWIFYLERLEGSKKHTNMKIWKLQIRKDLAVVKFDLYCCKLLDIIGMNKMLYLVITIPGYCIQH